MRMAALEGRAGLASRPFRKECGKCVPTRHPAFRMGTESNRYPGEMHYDFIGALVG
jgi:hypothetical protein